MRSDLSLFLRIRPIAQLRLFSMDHICKFRRISRSRYIGKICGEIFIGNNTPIRFYPRVSYPCERIAGTDAYDDHITGEFCTVGENNPCCRFITFHFSYLRVTEYCYAAAFECGFDDVGGSFIEQRTPETFFAQKKRCLYMCKPQHIAHLKSDESAADNDRALC